MIQLIQALSFISFNLYPASFLFNQMNYWIGPPAIPEKAADTIRISCLGDSITQGFVSTNEDTMSWPAQLQKMINDTRVEVFNFGRNGATMMKSGWKPYWN